MELIPEVPSTCMQLMGERYTEVKRLGAGNFGDALLVIDKKYNRYRVVKRLQKSILLMDPKAIKESRVEIANLSRVAHPNVVRFYNGWFDVDHHLHMLMEYCESGDLEDFVNSNRFPLPEVLVKSIFVQLLVGLDNIHHNHLLHRDIKAKNIFLTRIFAGNPRSDDPVFVKAAAEVGKIIDRRAINSLATDTKGYAIVPKIGDFGLSKAVGSTEGRAKTVAGTPFHFSPELAKQLPYTRRSDIWSLGVLFYFVLTRTMPFRGRTIPEVFSSILRDNLTHITERFMEVHRRPIPYSPELISNVMDMLKKEEKCRPTTDELLSRKYFGGSGVVQISPPVSPTTAACVANPLLRPPSGHPQPQIPARTTSPIVSKQPPKAPAPPPLSKAEARRLKEMDDNKDVLSYMSESSSCSGSSDDDSDDDTLIVVRPKKCLPANNANTKTKLPPLPRNKLRDYDVSAMFSFSEKLPSRDPHAMVGSEEDDEEGEDDDDDDCVIVGLPKSNDRRQIQRVKHHADVEVKHRKGNSTPPPVGKKTSSPPPPPKQPQREFANGVRGVVPTPTSARRPPSPPLTGGRVATPPKTTAGRVSTPPKGKTATKGEVGAAKTSPTRHRPSGTAGLPPLTGGNKGRTG